LFFPWTFGRRCCCSKGAIFPMYFKRLGFCDFWIVKGYMCKKDVAVRSRSSPEAGGEQCERGQKVHDYSAFKPLGVSEISEDPSGELGVFQVSF
jgi:hypothetical protein